MTKEFKEVSGHLNPRLYAAELFSKAHDLALYSEEKCFQTPNVKIGLVRGLV